MLRAFLGEDLTAVFPALRSILLWFALPTILALLAGTSAYAVLMPILLSWTLFGVLVVCSRPVLHFYFFYGWAIKPTEYTVTQWHERYEMLSKRLSR